MTSGNNKTTGVTLETLNFDNLALRTLPIDANTKIYSREVKGACFSRVQPTPVKNPQMVLYSERAMSLLNLRKEQLERDEAAAYFGGCKLIPGSEPAAHCYCGHQFGAFSGQLGDGATMYLGEVMNQRGERWEIQFKGAGLTPYSRTADGRKVLRSSLREFLCSEAMFNLGIPTTRAGTCVTSDSTVVRDILYNGNPILERCTIILRIAQTFLRFGSFQICLPTDRQTHRKGPSYGMPHIIVTLVNYTINTFYPEYSHLEDALKYTAFFTEITKRTAHLVAEWQCVGWCHGVLNTDNMSIVGVTIDYGPFGFIDRYDPNFICNGSDTGGRYSYAKQPSICKWNCKKLGEALQPVLDLTESRKIVDEVFDKEFSAHYLCKLRKKFGLFKEEPGDEKLFEGFFHVMYETGADFTNCFRNLNKLNAKDKIDDCLELFLTFCCDVNELKDALRPKFPKATLDKLASLIPDQEDVLQYLGFSTEIITSELEKSKKFAHIEALSNQQKAECDRVKWSAWFKDYYTRIESEYEDLATREDYFKRRIHTMNANNPRFVLRNHIVQVAIEKAEKIDFSEARALLKILENPFSEEPVESILVDQYKDKCINWEVISKFYENKPVDSAKLVVT